MATYWENSCSFGLRYVSWYKYLIVSLVFSHLGFWSGNLFLIAPFPDLCLLVPFCQFILKTSNYIISIYYYLKFGILQAIPVLPKTTQFSQKGLLHLTRSPIYSSIIDGSFYRRYLHFYDKNVDLKPHLCYF